MPKQKVFFFAAPTEDNGRMNGSDELRAMAADYVRIYGESCLSDPETPAFVRREMRGLRGAEMPVAG